MGCCNFEDALGHMGAWHQSRGFLFKEGRWYMRICPFCGEGYFGWNRCPNCGSRKPEFGGSGWLGLLLFVVFLLWLSHLLQR